RRSWRPRAPGTHGSPPRVAPARHDSADRGRADRESTRATSYPRPYAAHPELQVPICGVCSRALRRPSVVLSDKTAQHVLQDAAVAVVVRLTGGVDAHDRVELDRLLALGRELARLGGDAHRLGGDTVVERLEARDRHDLGSVEAERLPALPLGELQGDDTHPDEVRAVDALEALGDDRLDAEQRGALGRPVTRRSRAVLLAAEHDERDARRLVVHARVVDEGLRAARLSEVAGVPALDHLTV